MTTVQNIIVRMPNWLGDLVMATPVLADIRARWPEANITAMCQAGVAPLLAQDPHIDELYAFHKPSGWLHRQPRRNIIKALRDGQYDLGILLTNSLSSAWWFWRGQVKRRVGFAAQMRSPLLSDAVPFPANKETQHLVITYKKLLKGLGVPLSDHPPHLYLSEQEKENTAKFLRKYGITDKHILVGVNPGAAYGSAKCWLPTRFRQVTQRLLENPLVRVVYFGDNSGAPLVREICTGLSDRVVNLAGKTSIRELMSLIQACNVMLTNDSGPMHMAAALGTPLVALFGSTNDVATGPYNHGRVIHKHVPCSPCYKRECPIDFKCMTAIEVEEVVDELQRLIRDVKLPI